MAATRTNEVMPIGDVIEHLYNLPKDLYQEEPKWNVRPMSVETKLAAAANVAFLLDIQHTLIHDYLLRPFYVTANRAMTGMSKQLEMPLIMKQFQKNERENVEFDDVLNMSADFGIASIKDGSSSPASK